LAGLSVPDLLLALRPDLNGSVRELGWYTLAFVLVFPLEFAVGSQHSTTWSERGGNLVAMLLHLLAGGAILALALSSPIAPVLTAYPTAPRLGPLQNPYLWALVSAFVIDALFYVYHRLQHALPWFWHIHKLHHTDPAMNITTAKRSHFLERALQYFCLTVPMFWLLGFNPEGAVLAVGFTQVFVYIGHADVRLDVGILTPVIVGPLYHRLHHSRQAEHRDVNFAQVFPVFDIIGGTYRRPRWEDYPETGVEGCDTAYARWRPLI
jgi:sterol desaturase/sphingolipid hydroxylase (fatty acid hydroxylase superfamily)